MQYSSLKTKTQRPTAGAASTLHVCGLSTELRTSEEMQIILSSSCHPVLILQSTAAAAITVANRSLAAMRTLQLRTTAVA
jgi:hypothetical protein